MTATPVPCVAQALAAARHRGVSRLDAQLLLGHVLGQSRTWLLTHDETPLTPGQWETFQAACARRLDEVPLAYLTGQREFHGLSLAVGPGVLVPRPETEHLVDWALECLQGRTDWHVADLGTGSGAIALALAQAAGLASGPPGLQRASTAAGQITAVDRSAVALAQARANGLRLGLAVDWRLGPWWEPLTGQRFDIVASNPPYIAQADPHLAALRHEPGEALVAGVDGLDDIRTIVQGAADHLIPGGWLLLEHGYDQGPAVRALMQAAGLSAVSTRQDLAGLDRCTGGRRAS
jgi:release factor glutamine methyltransferase